MSTSKNHRSVQSWIVLMPGTGILLVALLSLVSSTNQVAARTDDSYGPACGIAVMDGVVDPAEWSSAATQTFQMVPGTGEPYTATLHVMNGSANLYIGITIDDDEFSPLAEYLPQGDGFRIDFDNDLSGSIYEPGEDVLSIAAGLPQFTDNYLVQDTASRADVMGGGSSDGSGAASRVGELNHFELRHPICSGDTMDFCLQPGDVVGFRLEYLDAQGLEWGGSIFYPGTTDTSIADIVIGTCSEQDWFSFLPLARK